MTLDAFLAKLDGVHTSGAGYTARCPAHDDGRASLSVAQGNRGIVVNCHAGCTAKAVMDALGLTTRDLFDDGDAPPPRAKRKARTTGKMVATYDYVDEHRAMLFQHVRYEPKDFRFRRPDGAGDWLWKLDGVRQVLYRLPELLAAPVDVPVFVVEGEKDADALIQLGFVATTNPDGAGKWRPEYTETLRARHVVIVPDNDEPGRAHANTVRRALAGVAASTRVLALPDVPAKGDVSDWLVAGHTADELRAVLETPPPAVDELADLLEQIETFVSTYVVFNSMAQPTAVALWLAHAHAIEAADVTPYLHVCSPVPRCGKTLLLDVLELVAPRPWHGVDVSEAVLFRRIDRDQPTLLFDEADVLFTGPRSKTPEAAAVRQVLNAGNRRGAVVPRCAAKGDKLVDFRVFCAKIVAGIGSLPTTIADRSVRITMVRRKKRSEPVTRFRRRDVEPQATRLRDALATWAATAEETLRAARPDVPDIENDRAEEAWEVLIAIADLAGGDWPARARTAMVELHGAAADDTEATGIQLLAAIRDIFNQCGDRVLTRDLLSALVRRETEPWAGWWAKDVDTAKDDETPKKAAMDLAGHLKPFGIISNTIRVSNDRGKGYDRADFEDAFSRYLPSQAAEGRDAVTTVAAQGFEASRPPVDETEVVTPETVGAQGLSPRHDLEPLGHEDVLLEREPGCEG
jgi:hypothetical protein